MTSLRRNLRPWVTAWLLCQVAALSALVPRDCCAAHRPATVEKQHGGQDEAPCPLHKETTTSADEPSNPRCSMRGTCAGPMAGLAALLSNQGVLSEPFAMLPDLHESRITVPTRENLITRLAPPNPPPPRA